jgi:hypothetical protein
MVAQVGYLMAGRSGGQVTLGAIYTVHEETMVCQWFGLKTTGTNFSSLASKPVATVFSGLTLKPVATVFSGLDSEPVARFVRFGPQNHADFSLSIAP